MQIKAKGELFGRPVEARDGTIGTVRDVYFDDRRFVVRYLEVDPGDWLPGQKLLVSPASIDRSKSGKSIAVALSREQVRDGPSPQEHMPVSRQFEEAHAHYFGYPSYWNGGSESAAVGGEAGDLKEAEERARQSHLHNSGEVIGYRVMTTAGSAGHVEDFLVDDENWTISQVVVDTRTDDMPGKHVPIPAEAVGDVVWLKREVRLKAPREAVGKGGPAGAPR